MRMVSRGKQNSGNGTYNTDTTNATVLCQYDSLNYEQSESAIYQQYMQDKTKRSGKNKIEFMRWVLTFLIAMLTAIIAFLVDISTEWYTYIQPCIHLCIFVYDHANSWSYMTST